MARTPAPTGDATDASQMSMFSVEDHPVRTGRWLDVVRDWLAAGVVSSSTSQASLIRSLPVGFSSRTSLVFSLPARVQAAQHAAQRTQRTSRKASAQPPSRGTRDGTSPSSSTSSPASTPESPPEGGAARVSALDPSELPSGVCLTLASSESPSGVEGSYSARLTDILEPVGSVASKYYLSPTACQGILRRAHKRGKTLPPALETALQLVASRTSPGLSEPPPEAEDGGLTQTG